MRDRDRDRDRGLSAKTGDNTEHGTRNILALLLIPATVFVFFYKLAFSNLILARGDVFLYFYPYWHAAREGLRSGRVPLWNPDIFMGAPLLANSQMGFFYPLNWPLWYFLDVPYAVSVSIVLHVVIAGWGVYWLARRRLGLGVMGAFLAAVLFALGGYLTAQVEHVNQVQGLAWLPWILGSVRYQVSDVRWREGLRVAAGLGVLFGLQLLAGHTQTAFISGVGLGVCWLLVTSYRLQVTSRPLRLPFTIRNSPFTILPFYILGVLLALLLAAVQLWPTLELIGQSSREGGLTLNEVLSFSWHPLLATRSLLPSYGQSLFTEYVAFVPVTAVLLAFVGAWSWRQEGDERRKAAVFALIGLTLLGMFLALGRFNGVYYLLGRLPGFDLFRVPARWLVLYGLGVSLLAGVGVERIVNGQLSMVNCQRGLRVGGAFIVGLIGWGFVSVYLARFVPVGGEAPVEWPGVWTVGGQVVELVVGYWLIVTSYKLQVTSYKYFSPLVSLSPCLLVILVLFLGSRGLPYNNLTAPEAYFELRPPLARILAQNAGREVDGRLLSVSQNLFDLGDQGEIATIYGDVLPPEAIADYVTATKQKGIAAPNLGMIYGTPSVDGFDGGILPLRSYSGLMAETVLAGQVSTDGRLREFLTAVPDEQWLDFLGAEFVITDKIGDAWVNGIYYDLQHPVSLAAGESVSVGYLPQFTATAILVHTDAGDGVIEVTAGDELFTLPLEPVEESVWLADLPNPLVLEELELQAEDEWLVRGVTLINGVNGSFQQLALGEYRQIHSGDVKIYRNLDVYPRAFVAADVGCLPAAACGITAAEIISYEPERVVVETNAAEDGWLVLTEMMYPGWTVTVDGESVEIELLMDALRMVAVPAGVHEVVFVFESRPVERGMWVSGVGLVILAVLLVSGFVKFDAKAQRREEKA